MARSLSNNPDEAVCDTDVFLSRRSSGLSPKTPGSPKSIGDPFEGFTETDVEIIEKRKPSLKQFSDKTEDV